MSIDRLSAGDEMMLRASATWPQHIGALAILDGSSLIDEDGAIRIDVVRVAVRSRLALVLRLRQRLVTPRRGLGPPFWVDVPDVDVRAHVRVRSVDAPGGEAELLAAVEDLRRVALPPDRPLWTMWLLGGLPERRLGMFVVLHHAIADGMAAMALFGAFLDRIEGPARPSPPDLADAPPAAPMPSSAALLADTVRRGLGGLADAGALVLHPRATLHGVRLASPALRELLASKPATKTSLNRPLGPDRNLALVRTTVDDVRLIARAHGASPNDVLLALTAGGIRAALVERGESVAGSTAGIYVPVSLRRGRGRREGADRGNRVAQMAVPVRLGEPDARRRLRAIAATTARRKRLPRPSLGTWFRGGIVTRLLLKAVARQRVNSTTACLRGPDRPLAFAGAPLLELYPILPLIGNVTLGVGVVTYAGTFGIGITADRAAYPDLDAFVNGVRADLAELAAAVTAPAAGAPARGPARRRGGRAARRAGSIAACRGRT